MRKKEFKAESKRVLDLMINSIYTNKEIFLRELISNSSDAIDKLYYESLTNTKLKIDAKDFEIRIDIDKEGRKLILSDNGIGMNEEELEKNLGTIARSGSLAFKEENKDQNDVSIIGQFGVGFYSAFMVSDHVIVESKSLDGKSTKWESNGIDGYTISSCEKEDIGTRITLHLKEDTEEENYSEFLTEYKIRSLVKKYSDYIKYPIKMEVENRKLKEGSDSEYETVKEIDTLNSMIPLWKKKKEDITEEEYNNFYTDKFYDYEAPMHVIHTKVEGNCTYNAILYIPSHAPYDFYTKEYEKGLQLYSNGVLIMDKCGDLLPDYFSFVRGVVDTEDLSLNISREMLQKDKHVGLIAKSIESKIKKELETMLQEDFEKYKTFFTAFGSQIKFGIYNNYGMDKDKLQDLLLFYSSSKKEFITLKEYIKNMKKDQKKIYYACGETISKIDLLPQVEQIKEKGFEILYLTDYGDEFTVKTLHAYEEKEFVNVSSNDVDLDTDDEKEALKKENEKNKEMFTQMKEYLSDQVSGVRFTNRLKNHPVCLTSEGDISVEMEKVINAMPTDEKIKANTILEINQKHPIAKSLKKLYKDDKKTLEKYTKVLYAQARLIEGLSIENPTEMSNLIIDMLAK